MVWIIIVGISGYILYRFFASLEKDNQDLEGLILSDKYNVIVNSINKVAFNGRGQVTLIDKRSFNLYEVGQNQIINFYYGTGHLTISWKYKYYQKEVVHEKQFNDVRNVSIFEQQKIAEIMIREMYVVIERHKASVLSFVELNSMNKEDVDDNQLIVFQAELENTLRNRLNKTLENTKQLSEMMHGVMLMATAGKFSEEMKNNYQGLKTEMEKLDLNFNMGEFEYKKMIDDVTSKVLEEFRDVTKPSKSVNTDGKENELPF